MTTSASSRCNAASAPDAVTGNHFTLLPVQHRIADSEGGPVYAGHLFTPAKPDVASNPAAPDPHSP